jgi:hypothetical protein
MHNRACKTAAVGADRGARGDSVRRLNAEELRVLGPKGVTYIGLVLEGEGRGPFGWAAAAV